MMDILPRYRQIFLILLVFLVCSECFPTKHKKPGHHRRTTRSHLKGHGHGKSTKKDSVRPSRQEVMAAVMHPGKLDMREVKELSQMQDFNKAYINNEMAAETSLLANQGIDDDSALRISNIEALPGALRGAYASSSPKTKFNDMKDDTTSMSKQNVAGFNQDEYMLDANSWPEYKIKDSDYMNRNFRVFPQGPNEGEGGFQGGMMPYGARGKMEEGMEGPYGDGNYGYPQPPQMASDQPSPPQMPDEGSQITSIPMNEANKVQRLVMKNNKHKHPASENFNDMTAVSSKGSSDKGLLHSAEGVSGSGEGSGSSDPNVKGNKAPSSPKGASDAPKALNIKSQEKVGGKGEVGADVGGKGAAASSAGGGGGTEGGSGDTTGAVGAGKTGSDGTDGTEAATTGTKANSENSEILSSQSKPEPTATSTKTPTPEKAKQTGDKTQNPTANGKSDSTNSKTESNASTGTPDSNLSSAKGSTAKEITNALSKAQGNTPLGEFAEFLKSKGITLTINKDKAMANSNSNDAPTPDKESQPSSTTAQSAPPPESMLASVLPTTGESLAQTSSNTNTNSKANDSQDSQASSNNLDNAVMNWQNIAPQNAGQIGELFLRQSTKQGHN